jgi:CheY-like chemotaxis protein
MHRPCFLILDPEHPGSISTRKLVVETAKFNVITAYSGAEALQAVDRFPSIDGTVLDSRPTDMPAASLITQLRAKAPKLPIVLIAAPGQAIPPEVNYTVDTLNPRALLDTLHAICPGETLAILQHDRDLEASDE